LEDRIVWLEDHIRRFQEERNFRPVVKAWRSELRWKKQLKRELSIGQPVTMAEIERRTDVLHLLRRNSTRRPIEFISTPMKVTIVAPREDWQP
jgi:hypothetical protein